MRSLEASDFQSPADPALNAARKRERRIRQAISAALAALSGIIAGSKVLDMLRRRDLYGLRQTIKSDEVQRLFESAYAPIAELQIEAANDEAGRALAGAISYDDLAGASDLIAQRAAFVSALQDQAADVMNRTMLDALRGGMEPDELQAVLEQVIGLNDRQAAAVQNYRRLLEQGDIAALNRKLRDARFDSTVQRAASGEIGLSQEQIDAMVTRYAQRQLSFRAATLAGDQAMKAATGGIRAAYTQAVQSGRLLDGEVRRFWLVTLDERTCEICASIPALNPNGVGVFEPYLSSAGPVMETGIHAHCRCSERYMADLTRLMEQPFAIAA